MSVNNQAHNKPTEDFHRFTVTSVKAGQRLDIYLTEALSNVNRSMIANLIRSGRVLVDNETKKAGYRIKFKEQITVAIPGSSTSHIIPEQVTFKIIHEDQDLIVISKPPGIVVHPACGHQDGTLVHGLLYHCKKLPGIGGEQRPGIVHRLDKDTSGVMVIAKREHIHQELVKLFKERKVKKFYYAILYGRPRESQGKISTPIGRHPVNRKKMTVSEMSGREAVTCWKILEELAFPYTYVELQPQTGRTHQLRVHMAFMGHPIAGDTLYGNKKDTHISLPHMRQLLHAGKISFTHPGSGKKMRFSAPLWTDMEEALRQLRSSK